MDLIKDIIFPPLCLSCRKYLETKPEKQLNLCNSCKEELKPRINLLVHCPSCSQRVNNLKNCCKNFLLSSVSSYENDVIRNLIHSLKYEKLETSITTLKPLIKYHLSQLIKVQGVNFKDWLIIPVPIHKKKLKERGFNQAELIARSFQKSLINLNKNDFSKIPFIADNVIIKTRKTESQTKMENYNKRSENIKDSFKLANKDLIENKNIILIDDVFTSGATMKEVVKELKKVKVKNILGFVITKS